MTNETEFLNFIDDAASGQFADVWAVFRQDPNVTPAKLATDEVTANSGAASNLLQVARSLNSGLIPESPSIAKSVRGVCNKLLKQAELRGLVDIGSRLKTLISQLSVVAEDETKQRKDELSDEELSRQLFALNKNGVYVFTLPHYRRHPIEDAEGSEPRTYLKVGKARNSVGGRVAQEAAQARYGDAAGRTTALPEDPVLLRIYTSDRFQSEDPRTVEGQFHRILKGAGFKAPGKQSGDEWYLTTLSFLDTIADVIGLEVLGHQSDF